MRESARNGSTAIEDDLAEMLARFEAAMRLGGLGERIDVRSTTGRSSPAKKNCAARSNSRLAAHVRAKQRELADEQDAQVDPRVVAGGGAAGDQPAAARQALEAAIPRRRADVLDDDVDAAAVGAARAPSPRCRRVV